MILKGLADLFLYSEEPGAMEPEGGSLRGWRVQGCRGSRRHGCPVLARQWACGALRCGGKVRGLSTSFRVDSTGCG
jgi:hypothetical protein